MRQTREKQKLHARLVNYSEEQVAAAMHFDQVMSEIKVNSCVNCMRAFPNLSINANNLCKPCVSDKDKFTVENRMDPGPIPPELADLTYIEQMLIAQIHPVVSFYKINNAQYAYRGNVINFRQDISTFARVLPVKPCELASTILFTKETPSGFAQFRARAYKIRAALEWLKKNNIYYRDIEISDANLALLPEDGDITDQIVSVTLDKANFNDECDSDSCDEEEREIDIIPDHEYCSNETGFRIKESYVPLLEPISQEDNLNVCLKLPYPKTDRQPINEFTEQGYIARAFPVLFPKGEADLRQSRNTEVTPEQYFYFLMQYPDRRFIKDTRFRFFALNSLMRWQALSSVSIYVNRMNIETLNAQMLRDMLCSDTPFLNQMMICSTRLRSTTPYWRQRCAELLDMVEQIGMPRFFFTLSAADYQWPDLFRLIDPNVDPDLLTMKQRRDLMHENADLAAFFFKERCEIFFKYILKPLFNVQDSWMRYEWQWRGSPHLHGLLWIDSLPCLEKDTFSEKDIEEIRDYFDELCSAINADIGDAVPSSSKDHPCRRRFSDIKPPDRLKDLSQLLNCVQRHTRCGSHCLRPTNRKRTKFRCRFKFPRKIQKKSSIDNTDGYYQYLPARNDEYLNRFNAFIAQLWRANIDFSVILSIKAVLRYIAKYATKGEKASSSFLHLLKIVLSNEPDETNVKKILQKLIMITLGDRDYSAQEVIHLLMKWPLYHSSRSFTCLNISDDEWKPVQRTGRKLSVGMSLIQKYKMRPAELETLSLYTFSKSYYTRQVSDTFGDKIPRFIKRKKESIVRVFPRLKLTGDFTADEKYYRMQVILNTPFRGDYSDLLIDYSENKVYNSWKARFVSLGLQLPQKLEYPKVEEEIVPPRINETHFVLPYIAASSMQTDNENTAIGKRLMDVTHDWLGESRGYPDVETVKQFLDNLKNQPVPDRNIYNDFADIELSDEQRHVLFLCSEQINYINSVKACKAIGKDWKDISEPKRHVIIQGKAGTGKSTLIRYIVDKVRDSFPENSIEVAAFSGAASVNVDGKTCHSLFKLPINRRAYTPLTGVNKGKFVHSMKHIKFIIIDEISMVSASLLYKIEKRCKEAHPKNSDELFGGMMVFLFGDFEQLPPVADTSLISSKIKTNRNTSAALGRLIFDQFFPIELKECQRQKGANAQNFRDLLTNLGEKTITDFDFDLLLSRNIPVNREFENALRIYTTKDKVKIANENYLIKNNQPVVRIQSINIPDIAINKEKDDEMHIGAYELTLSIGCKVMLRNNLWVNGGLFNGSVGILRAIIFEEDEGPPFLPLYVLVEFEKYNGHTFYNDCIPIVPITRSWINNDGMTMTRTQLPLTLAHALTVHKSQGLTLNKVILDLGPKEFAHGLSYVALSRVRKLTDLIIEGSFTRARFDSIFRLQAHRDLQVFLEKFRANTCALRNT